MADTARPISFLPSIKCSDCGAEIEISKMADHLCDGAPAEPEPIAPAPKSTKSFFGRAASGIRSSTSHFKPSRSGPPPSIDSNAANKPFPQRTQIAHDPLTPNSNPNSRTRPDDDVDAFIEHLQGQNNQPSLAGLAMASQMAPIQKDSSGSANKAAISLPRRPSEKVPAPPPKTRSQKGSIGEVPEWWDGPEKGLPQSPEKPLPQPNQHERKPSVAAHENAKRFPRRTSSRNISLKDLDLGPQPPVPQPPQLEVRSRGVSHAPSDSASSEESSSSAYDGRSSRSTPPTSAGTSPTNEPFKTYRPFDKPLPSGPNVSRPGTSTGPPPEAHRKTPSLSQQNAPEELQQPLSPPQIRPVDEAPESPMDPAIQRGMFTPRRPSDSSALPEIQSVVQDAAMPPVPPVPSQEEQLKPVSRTRTGSVGKRPGTAGKGNCRGCGELIVGKSVKAADGRLTGRWHKQCFTCRTCHSPFQTADFYVMDNHPYCAHHYHQLNGSLCRTCNYGIEGQYLETERRQKFHPQCFSCDTCRMPLRDDYFEVMGVVYCERHAFHAARQTGGPRGMMLAPGDPRRNPERRRTRLMMM
ncbi:Zinc finger LIM-type protein [Neofusicoccum parvum]|uniref:Zinc finger LIM-type protein n=1 Tax=Neofusicoccum parvum TaxID=310453 RepID=A0ACB5SF42_9PEZI|nr:Zinc finger LIM-type protein [Neofusicoccum parvum]